jgi:hypothetical protein
VEDEALGMVSGLGRHVIGNGATNQGCGVYCG